MTETVPSDIAAAIDSLQWAAEACGQSGILHDERKLALAERAVASSRAVLEAAILTHLRKADELKAALDRMASGGV